MTANDRDEEGKEVARLNSQLAGGMGQKVSLLCRARYSRTVFLRPPRCARSWHGSCLFDADGFRAVYWLANRRVDNE